MTVTIAQPEMVAKVLRYKLKADKLPSQTVLCQDPGAPKPKSCMSVHLR